MTAGLLTVSAQVYSLNVVGYINLNLTNGMNLVANQLDVDGTGYNNTVQGVFSNTLPVGAQVYKFIGVTWNTYTWNTNRTGTQTNWSGNASMNPGEGVFVRIPAAAPVSNNVTLVGQVLQGTLNNTNVPALGGLWLMSDIAPVGSDLITNLNYVPLVGDVVYEWNAVIQQYATYTYNTNRTGTQTNWSPNVPQVPVGTAFFLNTKAGQTWSQNFTVQ